MGPSPGWGSFKPQLGVVLPLQKAVLLEEIVVANECVAFDLTEQLLAAQFLEGGGHGLDVRIASAALVRGHVDLRDSFGVQFGRTGEGLDLVAVVELGCHGFQSIGASYAYLRDGIANLMPFETTYPVLRLRRRANYLFRCGLC